MQKISLYCFVYFFLFITPLFSQEDTLVVASYNLENLFDTIDDPAKDDQEFLPNSEREWNEEKLQKKLFNIARVIRSMDNFGGPDIIGFTEVENKPLVDLLAEKYLSDFYYKTAHVESPDNRGIDNGLLYNADKLALLAVSGDTVHLPDGYPTRQVIHVTLLLRGIDTIHVFVNHWPSRRGGEDTSEPGRIAAASTLRKRVDSLYSINPETKVIIVGDFNDEPNNTSIINTLNAKPVNCTPGNSTQGSMELYNTSYPLFEKGDGSFKFRDDWNMLDQVIISRSLIENNKFSYLCGSFEIYKPEFIITKSGNFAGTSIPTFGGKRYLGGYSDHFPVLTKFLIK